MGIDLDKTHWAERFGEKIRSWPKVVQIIFWVVYVLTVAAALGGLVLLGVVTNSF